jgi:hypothetical protein
VRKDDRGLVLAQLRGPGVVTRIATPTPTDDPLELYFDGETEPRLRLPFREKIGGENVRMLSLEATGEDIFGPHHVALELEAPAAGRYRILVEAVAGPSQGKLRLYRNEEPLGEPVDLYASERAKRGPLLLGEADLEAGGNILFFRSAGKDPASQGIDIDLVRIVLERVKMD